jgi:hypothetical protein
MNKKTGPIPVTMTERASCPDACPWKDLNGCYAEYGPLGMQWRSLDGKGKQAKPISWDELCKRVGILPKYQIWRHNSAGDLPGANNRINIKLLDQLVQANAQAKAHGFTYTHYPIGFEGYKLVNAQAIFAANHSGFTISISADGLKQADKLADLGIGPVVATVPIDHPQHSKTPDGRTAIVCPAEYSDMTCDRCQLCYKQHKAVVSFRAHGPGRLKVNRKLMVIQ